MEVENVLRKGEKAVEFYRHGSKPAVYLENGESFDVVRHLIFLGDSIERIYMYFERTERRLDISRYYPSSKVVKLSSWSALKGRR